MAEMPEIKPEKKKSVSVGSVLSKESKPKAESKDSGKSSKKKKMKHTHIEHHNDGSHTVRHTPMGGGEEMSYSKPDLDGVHDGLEEHVGDPNAAEGQPMADGGGAPEQQPQPAAPQQAQPAPAAV